VARLLSFCTPSRELAGQITRTDPAEGQAEAKVVSEDDTCYGGWDYFSAMVSERADQFSAAIIVRGAKTKGE